MIIPMNCPHCSQAVTLTFKDGSQAQPCPECDKSVPIDNVKIKPGVVIGKGYHLDRLLDEDSQVQVFIATQEAMQREVAIKIIPPDIALDEEKLHRFKREVKLAATLEHSNILTAYGAGQDCGVHFLIKQYAPGQTLEELCLKQGSIPERDTVKYVLPIAEALCYAWEEKRVIHRNIKPENILISDTGRPLLMDLGIAKSMEPDAMHVTSAGFTVGTPEYMSPEQVRGSGDIDWRADQYSLGIVMYRCVTGVVPFADPSAMSVMQKQLKESPVPAQFRNSVVSTACSTMIDKLLAKDREQRYASWEEVISSLRGLLKGAGASARGKKKGKQAKGHRKASAGKRPRAKKKAAAERQGKAVSREDVHRIAQEMYGSKNSRQKLIFYGLSILLPIVLVAAGFYYINTVQREKWRIQQAVQDAVEYAARNPTSFDTAIAKYERVRELTTPGTEPYIAAEKRISELYVAKILYGLKQKSEAHVDDGEWDKAIKTYLIYNGPYSGETDAERKRRAEELRRRREQSGQ